MEYINQLVGIYQKNIIKRISISYKYSKTSKAFNLCKLCKQILLKEYLLYINNY